MSYTYGDDLISQTRQGVTSYYHYDGQMSTRQLTDNAAVPLFDPPEVTDSYTYDAFGNLLTSTGPTTNNYLYTGEQYDPNVGFYYLRARYYNQANGRFINRDSFEGSIWEPQSLHKYLYANTNPVNLVDPSGNSPGVISIAISLAFIALIIGLAIYSFHYQGTDEFIVRRAIGNAAGLVDNAIAKMRRWSPSDQAEYTKWFGTPTPARRSKVIGVLLATRTALKGHIIWHRSHHMDRFAHVFPDPALEVWLAPAFWAADALGTDSQAGVFVHEMSHEASSTKDHKYHTGPVKAFAISDPALAVDNADSYEYFTEVAP